jgi:hypothetical protein
MSHGRLADKPLAEIAGQLAMSLSDQVAVTCSHVRFVKIDAVMPPALF